MDPNINYSRIEEAIKFLAAHYKRQPSLAEIASFVNVSPYHFQRLFTEWAGISPKKFIRFLTIEQLKKELSLSSNLSEAADRVGLSTPSRVYDLFVSIEAVTPQQYKSLGQGLEIEYGFHTTPFGLCFIAITAKGICAMSFIENISNIPVMNLAQKWPGAQIHQNQVSTTIYAQQIFSPGSAGKLPVFVQGTNFQVKVWEALLRIPFGSVSSYQAIAQGINQPTAMRAVGTAVGSNPIAYLIPCHRVIRSEGIIGNYMWGAARKTAIIGWEKARYFK